MSTPANFNQPNPTPNFGSNPDNSKRLLTMAGIAIAVLLGGKLGIVTVLMVITLGPVIEWLGNIMKQHLNIFDD